MAENPEAALDLPLKVLVWEDKLQQVWITYNNIEQIKERFSLNLETAKLTELNPLLNQLLSE